MTYRRLHISDCFLQVEKRFNGGLRKEVAHQRIALCDLVYMLSSDYSIILKRYIFYFYVLLLSIWMIGKNNFDRVGCYQL